MKERVTDKKWFIYALVPVCALLWGFSFFGTTVALEVFAPIQLLAMRWSISAVLFIVLAATKLIKINFKGKNLKLIMFTGFLQPCIYSLFETNGIGMTTTSESSIFIATIPLMVLIIGTLFLHKKNSPGTIFAILLAFGGVIVCTVFSPGFSIGGKGMGYLVLMGAVVVGACYTYASSKASEQFNSVELTFGMSIMGAIFFNVLSLIKGYGFEGYAVCFKDIKMMVAVVFLGICCSCLCYLIFNLVLGKMPTAIGTNLISNSTTAVGVLTGCVFAGDPFGWFTVVGLAMTITGICLSSLEDNRLNKEKEREEEVITNEQS